MDSKQRWDFFLAHAGPDQESAEALYESLAKDSQVFLDSRCLHLGDDWDTELAAAQRASLITVVLVSPNTPQAYYQREEVAAAITFARQDPETHRVVPIYLMNTEGSAGEIPYGLRLKQGISVKSNTELDTAAVKLLGLLRFVHGRSEAAPALGLSEDEEALVLRLFRFSGRCMIGAAHGEYECLWVPGDVMDMQWGWERTLQEAQESGKAVGDRVERMRWIFVTRDLAARNLLAELPKQEGQRSTLYELTQEGWRAGYAIAARSRGGAGAPS
jgi:TIR domain